MALRGVRNAVSLLCAIAPLVLIPMWVRSYHRADQFCGGLIGHRSFLVSSKQGCVTAAFIGPTTVMDTKRWSAETHSLLDGASFPTESMREYQSLLGFGWIAKPNYVLDFEASADDVLTWTRIPAGTLPAGIQVVVTDQRTGNVRTSALYLYNAEGPVVAELGISGKMQTVFGLPGAGPIIPYWFLVLTSGVLFAATRFRRPWRFSLRSLLAAMTYAAVLLAIIAVLNR
jgi:hypothetical protein